MSIILPASINQVLVKKLFILTLTHPHPSRNKASLTTFESLVSLACPFYDLVLMPFRAKNCRRISIWHRVPHAPRSRRFSAASLFAGDGRGGEMIFDENWSWRNVGFGRNGETFNWNGPNCPPPPPQKSICFSCGRIKQKLWVMWGFKIFYRMDAENSLIFFWTEVDGFCMVFQCSVGPLLVIDGGRSLLNGIINYKWGARGI